MNSSLQNFVTRISPNLKKYFVMVADFISVVLSYLITTLSLETDLGSISITSALLFAFINVIISNLLKNYNIFWGLFSQRDAIFIVISILLSISIFASLESLSSGLNFYSILSLISLNFILLSRKLFSQWRTIFGKHTNTEKLVILGAGAAGAQLVEQLKSSLSLKVKLIGFLDDFQSAQRKTISGLPVLGTISQLEKMKQNYGVTKAILAIPSATRLQINTIHSLASKAGVELKMLPSLDQILDGRVNSNQIKDIEPEDLLGRDPIFLDEDPVNEIISKQTILITGSGGSIGSELCFQIAKFAPTKIILFEQTELFLYQIEMKLKTFFTKIELVSIVGDVRNSQTLESVIASHKPSIIFHAAAYKHVPLMESNPTEALFTNLIGTNNVALLSVKYNVSRFVLISTDKAVNPTNVMGATKRAAELACQIISENQSETKFMIVRFGNVLGSSGSVIPLFKQQISSGGPVTVTHKDITRYFMSIPEACRLVMYAGAIGNGGEVYVLEMGEPVKINELAEKMIRLSGLEPEKDIQIEYTGLRKGEKMYEELLSDSEKTSQTRHPKIRIAHSQLTDDAIKIKINAILNLGRCIEASNVKKLLKDLLPEYNPES